MTGYASDFVADTVLQRKIASGFSITDKIDINASGIATCPGGNFTGIKTDTIVRYQLPNETVERFNRVTEVLSDGSISLAAVASVTGAATGLVFQSMLMSMKTASAVASQAKFSAKSFASLGSIVKVVVNLKSFLFFLSML